jgi:anti-sigma regulatory factor (Ser/Thr protein kinase)
MLQAFQDITTVITDRLVHHNSDAKCPVSYQRLGTVNDPCAVERFSTRYEQYLKHKFARGEEMASAMTEVLKNHVRYGVRGSWIEIHQWWTPEDVHIAISGEGDRFDVVSVWVQKQHWVHTPQYVSEVSALAHGLGMTIIAGLSDLYVYTDGGRGVNLGFSRQN